MSIGLTQRELADAAGMSIGALRDLEQGRTRCPRWGAVAAFAAALDMDRNQRAELASAWSGGQPDGGSGYGPLEGEAAGVGGTGVRIGVLGLLTVLRGPAVVELGSSRQRAVLGLLALHGPTGVNRDAIVDVLWRDRPPRSAVAEVQAYISRLRRLLDPGQVADGPVILAGRYYRLGYGIGVDLADFGELSRCADGVAAQGEFRLACALYERSLALWRGEVLADVDLLQGHLAAAEAARRRGDVVLRFARAAAAVGCHERMLPHLRDMCAREPLNEQAHAYLMTALAATGQQAAAVMLFGELMHRLDRELGIRPGPQLAATHVRIMRM
jgi:DNA-binding SARP family transcriptional activator